MSEPWVEQSILYQRGEGDYHTYRIPALIRTTRGTLLAFCEGRRHSGADHGDIDVLLRRSFDGGVTWTEPRVIQDGGGPVTAGNPAPVVDRETGRIHLHFCIDNRTAWVTESDDDGETWSEPREITQYVKDERYPWYATGPCHGIQLQSGRLLIPAYQNRHSHTVYSDDHGATWHRGATLTGPTGECAAVETVDGRVYMNCRNQNEGTETYRLYAWSSDGGENFTESQYDMSLVEPPCQGSVVRLSTEADGGRNRILFSNPRSRERTHMTVQISYDECQTWTPGRCLYEGPSAYSDLCVLPDGTILCLYERGVERPYETLTLARFNLSWLTDGKDHL